MSVRPASEYRALMEANAELRRERDHAREEWHRQNERADDYRRQLLDETYRPEGVEIVKLDGRGFPPEIAARKLRKACRAEGCPCDPQYRAGVRL